MDCLIIWLMLINLISQSSFSMLAPFYPGVAIDERGMTSSLVGVVMSLFSVSFVITSFVIGTRLGKIGRRLSMYMGIFIQCASIVGFGCLIWVKNKLAFMLLSFAFRLIAGVAWAFIWVTAYAMTSIRYPDNLQSKISLLEAANGAGMFVGPIFGGVIYQFTNFWVPFFIFSGIFMIFPLFMKKSFTADLDRNDENENSSKKISYISLLKNRRVLFAGLAQLFNVVVISIGQPTFGPRLENAYEFNSSVIGVCFALPTVFYIITGLAVLPFLKCLIPRSSMMIGFMILFVSLLLIGPSKVLPFPDKSAVMMIVGLCVLGFGAAWTIIPIIPEMLDSVKGQYEDQKSELSDRFSGIFNMAGGFGQIVGPVIAGALDEQVGFNYTFDIFAGLILAFNIAYILLCGGVDLILACRKKKALENGSPKHHLLADEEAADYSPTSDEEGFEKIRKANLESLNKTSDSNSTNTSLNHDNSYSAIS